MKQILSIFKAVCISAFIIANSYSVFSQYNFGHIDYKQGLSHNQISSFAEDNNGFLWIGTRNGLNRYDGYEIKTFLHDPNDSTSIPSNVIEDIVKDQLGRFWINLPYDLCIFNPSTEEFLSEFSINVNHQSYQDFSIEQVVVYDDSTLFLRIPGEGIVSHNIITNKNKILTANENEVLLNSTISHIFVKDQQLYITYANGVLDIFNANSLQLISRNKRLQEKYQLNDKNFESFVDNEGHIFVFCHDEALGLFHLGDQNIIQQFNTSTKPALNSNIIACIIESPENTLWIGTDHGGINVLDINNLNIDYITKDPYNENTLKQNVITKLFVSNDSIIWIGTFKEGVHFYHKDIYRYWHYLNIPNTANTLPYNDVNCFAEDEKGNIWIGTNGFGLIYFDRKNNTFKSYQADSENSKALQSNVIVSLCIDKDNVLWVGTYHGGLSSFNGKEFKTYRHDPEDSKSISDNKIWDVFEDSMGRLWVGMLGGGLDLLDREKQEFLHYCGEGIDALDATFVMDIEEDDQKNIWIGTDQGVFVIDHQSSRFIRYQKEEGNEQGLSDNFVYNVFKDSKGSIWAGTRNGLNYFNSLENRFIPIKEEKGNQQKSIMSILESDHGNLWLGTSSGLVKLVLQLDENGNYEHNYSLVFDESDGLQGREFNEGSALKTKNGELIFGGSNGFNLFIPERGNVFNHHESPHILGLEIFGKYVAINKPFNDRIITTSASLNDKKLQLNSSENMFSIDFALIDFLTPKKIHYRYKLEGFNDQWIYTSWQQRKATYTNLSPGTYDFIVQASDYSTAWENAEASMRIRIHPPWYLSWYAYIVYLIILGMVFYGMKNYISMRIRNRYLRQHSEEEALRQHELSQLKTRFFTNVSHEFRTPLTLILTPLDSLLKRDLDEDTKRHLNVIRQNAARLLNLVNQLLDFRKAGENKLALDLTYGNIINLLRKTVDSFKDLSENKQIELKFVTYENELFMQFDKDKVEKIIYNLLSNAFKFTKEGGSIQVITQIKNIEEKEYLRIKVQDMGIGIEKEHREKLFERFYQVNQSRDFVTTGSGIGLSLSKEFVELHQGSIDVESEPGQGSCFTVKLPINRERLKQAEEESKTETGDDLSKMVELSKDKRTILLVEDNAEFRSYLKESLEKQYNILEADNGEIALNILDQHNPDLIVTDIMMPVMDGIQLTNQVKTNPEYSHIPIILLTAKSTHEDKVAGFKVGADEYITKPFDLDILESRIEYLIHLRQRFIKEYQKNFTVESESKTISPLDEKLLNRILELINTHISNADFSVNMLSKEMGVSRVHLYKKTMALTGKTPIELIRLVRLRKAADLLLSGQLTISEITYDVGFNDPRYFSKLFKAEFGVLPSKYKNQISEEGEEVK